MIEGHNFIWLHIPKCAGHTVEMALRAGLLGRSDVRFDRRFPEFEGWHDGLAARRCRDKGFDPTDKRIIAGFRRLPHWILSRAHFEVARAAPLRHAGDDLSGRVFRKRRRGFVCGCALEPLCSGLWRSSRRASLDPGRAPSPGFLERLSGYRRDPPADCGVAAAPDAQSDKDRLRQDPVLSLHAR